MAKRRSSLVALIFYLLLLCAIHNCHGQRPTTDLEIRNMFKELLQNYDPKLRPDYLGPPVMVSVDATILSITNLDAINMMYTVDMFFRQRWKDHRLAHTLNETLTIIVGTRHPSDIIWTPDTVFINSVTSSMHHVTVNNHKLDIYPDGSVFWGTRVTVSPSCILDLKAYPMDKQQCEFEIVSYAYNSRHLKYTWHRQPGVKLSTNTMAQFELKDYKTIEKEYSYVAGNYTVLIGKFKFFRLMGFAILQIYVPSIAVVCVSWISLWIRRNATPARVALCITTLLTISTIWASVNAQLPRVNYVKAIDIFMMTSFCCVIFTLLEYTIVLNCSKILDIFRRQKRNKSAPVKEDRMFLLTTSFTNQENPNNQQPLMNNNGHMWPPSSLETNLRHRNMSQQNEIKKEKPKIDPVQKKKEEEENEQLAERIEIFARIFFPLAYAIFNVFYWITYSRTDPSDNTIP